MKHVLLLCVSLLSLSAFGQDLVSKVSDVNHGPLSEVSGIVKSQTYDDTYWVHNDSGDNPRLFSIRADGSVIFPPFADDTLIAEGDSNKHWQGVPVHLAVNQDWEDIALHDGVIYIADIGNNGNMRRDLGIYVVREPNPLATTNVRTLKYLPLQYPDQKKFPADQWHFDSESMFIDAGVVYFITKHRQPGKISEWEQGAKLYRLDTQNTDEVNELVYLETNADISLATASDLSPNGEWLAVLCYTDIWLFQRPESGDNWLSSKHHRVSLDFDETGQVEAISWVDDEQLLFTNEPGQLFTIERSAILKESGSE